MDLSRIQLSAVTGDGVGDLAEFNVPPADPVDLAGQWISRAIERGVREAGDFALATADAEGRPSSRVVLLKGFDRDGLLFVGQTVSRKGTDIAANPRASASFYWQELRQQLHFAGPVAPVDPALSDELFSARSLASKAAAAASHQDGELADENVLNAEVQRLVAAGKPIERPARWVGYRLAPERIEFWQGGEGRLHRRLEYTKSGGSWTWRRLQP
ncbi:MAG: pyridoxal 5'-phosphate synthase [Actinobacteria bacterium]|nr:pyridoxal 5'-phosphate synthase [Actinomycetota bacterium]